MPDRPRRPSLSPAHRARHRVVLAFAGCGLLLGCGGGGTTVELQPELPADYSDALVACTVADDPIDAGCLPTLLDAVERSDRSAVGQILLARATDVQDDTQRRHLVRAALWLNPKPWAPERLLPIVPEIAAAEVPTFDVDPGAFIYFWDAEGPAPTSGGALASAPLARVDVPIPVGAGPLGGDALVGTLTAAAGGVAAAWQRERNAPVRIVPAAPLFERLSAREISGVEGAWDAMVLIGQADALVRRGELVAGWQRLGDGIAALPEGAGACSSRGMAIWARIRVGGLARLDSSDDYAALDAACLERDDLDPDEMHVRDYLDALSHLGTWATTTGRPDSSSERLRTPEKRAEFRAAVEALEGIDGRQRAILVALLDLADVYAEKPTGYCDADYFDRMSEARRAIGKRLEDLGRIDAAFTMTVARSPIVDGRIDRDRIAALSTWVRDPGHRYLVRPALGHALGITVPFQAIAERAALAPLCAEYLAVTERTMRADDAEGALGRNVTRAFDAVDTVSVCGGHADGSEMIDVLVELAGPTDADADAALALIGHASLEIGSVVLQGRAVNWVEQLDAFLVGMDALRDHGLTGEEAELVYALLDVIRDTTGIFTGRPGGNPADSLGRLVSVSGTIADRGPQPEGSMAVRLAPAFRSGGLALLTLLEVFQDDSLGALAAVARLQAVAEADVAALMENFGAPEHADAMARVVSATLVLGNALAADQPEAWDGVRDAIAAATPPGDAEEGYWALGFTLARFLLWDGYALMVGDADAERTDAALVEAEGLLAVGVASAIENFELDGSPWEVLRVLPMLHRFGVEVFAQERDPAEAFREVAPPLGRALESVAQAMVDAPETSIAGLVGVLASEAVAVGVAEIAADPDALVGRYTERVEGRLADMTPDTRAAALLILGGLEVAVSDSTSASGFFRDAETALRAGSLSHLAYMPSVLEAAVALRVDENPEAALTALERALAFGDEALTCGKAHPVHALLPTAAYLADQLGRHPDAVASIEAYRDLVDGEDTGLGGDADLTCVLTAQQDIFITTATVGQSLSTLFLPLSTGGTFQLGAGFTTIPADKESFVCTEALGTARRADIIAAHLATAAARASAVGDRMSAAQLFAAARGELRELEYGAPQILLRRADALAEAREALNGDVLVWSRMALFASGHFWLARGGMLLYPGMDYDTSGLVDPETGELVEIPPPLAGLEFEAWVGPAVKGLVEAQANPDPAAIERAFADVRGAMPDDAAVPMRILQAQLTSGVDDDPQRALADLELIPRDVTTRSAIDTALVESWSIFVEAVAAGSPPDMARVEGALGLYVDNEMPAEALAFAKLIFEITLQLGDSNGYMALGAWLDQKGLSKCTAYATLCGDIHEHMATYFSQLGNQERVAESLGLAISLRSGRVDPGWELQARQSQLGVLVWNSDIPGVRTALTELLATSYLLGPRDMTTMRLLLSQAALDVVVGDVATPEQMVQRIEGIIADFEDTGLLSPEDRRLAAELRTALPDIDRAKEVGVRYVRWVTLGEQF